MCSLLRTVPAAAGLGLILLATSPAGAVTLATPAGLRAAADTLGVVDAVHCRRYPHRHKDGHGWGRGCGDATRPITRGSGDIYRAGLGGPLLLPRMGSPSSTVRPTGNYYNPANPQDRSGNSNRQDMLQPRKINPQDMLPH